ncbi:MAG: Gfo/Idh/MocA family oxidoreductase [Kiritimatiellae bacterium]|nr:Gfo/Idh/MocA family oxidoreductase [Kiritimatiellia bacterium]
MELNRRNFLLGGAAASLAAGHALADAPKPPRTRAAGEKPTLALIGMGIQARGLLHQFLGQDILVTGICDVDKIRRERGVQTVENYYQSRPVLKIPKGVCRGYSDFREVLVNPGIDMVCVATPDHWHAYITVEAMKAGKDVYCEKPLTYSVEEARIVMEAEKKYGRVLQTGAMQRSSVEFRTACEIVRNGFIGDVRFVDTNFGQGTDAPLLGGPSQPHRFFSDLKAATTEGAHNPDVDWNRWVGPAPWSPYSDKCAPRGVHDFYPMFWRFDDNYGSGYCGDWGAHHLDIAQWGLGMDDSGPVKVLCSKAPHSSNPIHGGRRQQDMQFVFANGAVMQHNPFSTWGTVFYGTEGIVAVNRGLFAFWLGKGVMPDAKVRAALANGSFDAMRRVAFWNFRKPKDKPDAKPSEFCDKSMLDAVNKAVKETDLKHAKTKLYKSLNHPADFVARFLDRKSACSSAQVGGRSSILCQLCNISYIYDSSFDWDPAANTFANGTGDEHWLSRAYYRDGWKVVL